MKYLNFAKHVQSNDQPEILLTLIDLSGSMDEKDIKPSRKEAAIKANQEIIRVKRQYYPNDKIGIISFQETAKLSLRPMQAWNIGDLSRKINDAGLEGGTDFTAPLKLAYSFFLGKPANLGKNPITKMLSNFFIEPGLEKCLSIRLENDSTKRRIVLLTDGEHLGDENPIHIVSRLKRAGVIIDCIGIGGSPKDVDEKVLKKIASRNPNGSIRYCFIGDQQKLLRKYQTLAHHIRAI